MTTHKIGVEMIKHASVLRPISEWGPGLPVLSMRHPWGWARWKVERAGGLWMPESAPSNNLLIRHLERRIPWREFEMEYRDECNHHPWVFEELLRCGAVDSRSGLVLLCWELEGKDRTVRCHRTILADMLQDYAASRTG